MALEISKVLNREIEDTLKKYPNKEAALLPILHLLQKEFGYMKKEVMELAAERLSLPYSKVKGVATFYTMYNKKPVGKYHVQVCRNISCSLRGSADVLESIKGHLNLKEGESNDKFTLSTVECLGSCGTGPVMQVNDDYYEELTPESVKKILDSLK
jgi:NADH-quinone oxidoreductase subunit E